MLRTFECGKKTEHYIAYGNMGRELKTEFREVKTFLCQKNGV